MKQTRNEVPLYTKKIQELHAEVESLAGLADGKRGEHDRLIADIASSEKRLNQANSEVSLKETHLGLLDGIIARKQNEIEASIRSANQREREHLEKIAEHSEKIEALSRSMRIHEQKIGEYKDVIGQVGALQDKHKSLSLEIGRIEADMRQKSMAIASETEALEKTRLEVRDETEKNGRRLSDMVVRKGELEVWVRTLQRYYDESGINMRILPLFGLEEGNH